MVYFSSVYFPGNRRWIWQGRQQKSRIKSIKEGRWSVWNISRGEEVWRLEKQTQSEVTRSIDNRFGSISKTDRSNIEVNIIRWTNGRKKLDIRVWSSDGTCPKKGPADWQRKGRPDRTREPPERTRRRCWRAAGRISEYNGSSICRRRRLCRAGRRCRAVRLRRITAGKECAGDSRSVRSGFLSRLCLKCPQKSRLVLSRLFMLHIRKNFHYNILNIAAGAGPIYHIDFFYSF